MYIEDNPEAIFQFPDSTIMERNANSIILPPIGSYITYYGRKYVVTTIDFNLNLNIIYIQLDYAL